MISVKRQAKNVREEALYKIDAMMSLRDSLRNAIEMANRSGTYAGQDYAAETTIADAKGVYGLVSKALDLMGEDTDHWIATNEWVD